MNQTKIIVIFVVAWAELVRVEVAPPRLPSAARRIGEMTQITLRQLRDYAASIPDMKIDVADPAT